MKEYDRVRMLLDIIQEKDEEIRLYKSKIENLERYNISQKTFDTNWVEIYKQRASDVIAQYTLLERSICELFGYTMSMACGMTFADQGIGDPKDEGLYDVIIKSGNEFEFKKTTYKDRNFQEDCVIAWKKI